MTTLPPDLGPLAKWRKRAAAPAKAWAWLSSRRTSRAIKDNKALTLSLAASVAAVGAGGLAVHDARQAQHDVAALAAQVNQLRQDSVMAITQAAFLAADVEKLDARSAKELHALRNKLVSMGITMDHLAAMVSSLPPSPDLAPVYARISRAAKNADKAVKQANIATAAAADQVDDEARSQAGQANDAAGVAAEAARAAQKKADEAAAKAQEALDEPDPIIPTIPPIPPFEFPRVIDYPATNTTVTAGPISKSVSADLPKGDYRATLTVSVDTTSDKSWYVNFAAAGQPAKRVDNVGSAVVQVPVEFTSGGGVSPFGFSFDVYVNGTNVPVRVTAFLTLEQLEN